MSNGIGVLARGAANYPVQLTAASAGVTAGLYQWRQTAGDESTRYTVKGLYIHNESGQTMYVKYQGSTSNAASTLNWDTVIPTGTGKWIDWEMGSVSIWFPAGATANRVSGIVTTGGTAGSTSPATFTISGSSGVNTSAINPVNS